MVIAIASLAAACGARTGLYPGPESSDEDAGVGGAAGEDSGAQDVSSDVWDSAADADADSESASDSDADVPFDAPWEAEAEADAPFEFDAPDDVIKDDCTDPTIQYVYVVHDLGEPLLLPSLEPGVRVHRPSRLSLDLHTLFHGRRSQGNGLRRVPER